MTDLVLILDISYVDNQLRHSRRFDADGIEQDHPELFIPFSRRRSSSNNSMSSLSSNSTNRDDFFVKEHGQLRYWTSDMCSRSPHLFDFVVTVSFGCFVFANAYVALWYHSSEAMARSSSRRGFSSVSGRQSSRSRSAPSVS